MHKRTVALIVCVITLLSAVAVLATSNHEGSRPQSPTAPAATSDNGNVAPQESSAIGKPTITVPDDYPTISAAVGNATAGAVIFVKQGLYVESVTVDKPLTLEGENNGTTIVDGNNMGPTFLVESDNVTITGFTVRNVAGAPPPSASLNQLPGIHLLNVQGCKVFGNVVVNCGKGVWVYGGSDNQVFDNQLSGNNYGVLVDSSTQNLITGNTAFNGYNGMLLESSTGNTLRNNSMYNNTCNFGATGDDPSLFLNNVDSSNTVNGKSVYYLIGKSQLTIDSASYPNLGALILVNCNDVTVQNLDITNSYGGIHLVKTVNSAVTNNIISSSYEGVWVQFSSGCTVSNNDVSQNSNIGISVEASTNILVLNNNIEQNDSTFISISDSSNCNIDGNSLQNPLINSLPKGILLQLSNDCNIVNNSQVANVGAITAIDLENSSYNFVQSNDFGLTAPGININDESNYNQISNNTFSTERGSYGVELFESYFNNLSNNVVNNFFTGLQLDNASNNTLSNNIVTSQEHAAEISKFNNNTFDSNIFLGATDFWDLGAQILDSPSVNTWIENGTVTHH
ncbi:MAG: NosD domain-containing protein [Candidatus Bathyarchaeia archaeon]